MSFKMPSTKQVRELGDSLGIDVTDSYAGFFIDFIKPFADGYRLIASLPDDVPEIKYPRGPYYRPEGEENKHGAWIAKAHVKGASSGKLAGKAGTFVLHHVGVMNRGASSLSVTVVPDSGTGELTGIEGEFNIQIVDGKHSYEFVYRLPAE